MLFAFSLRHWRISFTFQISGKSPSPIWTQTVRVSRSLPSQFPRFCGNGGGDKSGNEKGSWKRGRGRPAPGARSRPAIRTLGMLQSHLVNQTRGQRNPPALHHRPKRRNMETSLHELPRGAGSDNKHLVPERELAMRPTRPE